jgi:hypothetical protein
MRDHAQAADEQELRPAGDQQSSGQPQRPENVVEGLRHPVPQRAI